MLSENIEIEFLHTLKDKSILLYLSSCDYNDDFLHLPYDYVILNSFFFRRKEQGQYIRLVKGKVMLMPFDNEYAIRLLIDAGLKINCFVGIQDGCVEDGNHECINSQTFFSRLSPLLPKEFIYITNHFFNYRKPEGNRLPFTLHPLAMDQIHFDPVCLYRYTSIPLKLKIFKVKRIYSESLFFKAGKIHIHVHHTSIWDSKGKVDGWVIPDYPPNVLMNYLPDFNNHQYLMQRDAKAGMLNWANKNKHNTVAAVAFDTEEKITKVLLPQLKNWSEPYPKRIDFYHLKKNELRLFRTRPTDDPTEILFRLKKQDERYTTLNEYLEFGQGDPYIVSYLMLQYGSKALKPLVKGLNCPEAEMRFHCVDCLVKLGDIRAVNPLIQMFKDSENESNFPMIRTAIRELCQWGSMDLVYRALNFDSSDIRTNMVKLISEMNDEKTSPESEVHLKGSSDSGVLMKKVGSPKESEEIIWEPLTTIIEQLNDPDPKKKITATEILGERANHKATMDLCLLLYDYNPEVQLAAIKALRQIGDKRATAAFTFFLPQKTCYHRQEMAEAIGELRDRRAVPVLARVYNSAWMELRVEIIQALCKIDSTDALKTVINALSDPHPKIRFIVIDQLKNPQDTRALKSLKQALPNERNSHIKGEIERAIQNYWVH